MFSDSRLHAAAAVAVGVVSMPAGAAIGGAAVLASPRARRAVRGGADAVAKELGSIGRDARAVASGRSVKRRG